MSEEKERKIIMEYELPVYPIPIGDTEPRDFQSVGKLRLMTDVDSDPSFHTADKIDDIGRELQSLANHIIKGSMEVMRTDPDAIKYFLVRDKLVKATYDQSRTEDNTTHDTHTQSPGDKKEQGPTNRFNSSSTPPSGDMKELMVLMNYDTPICPICWDEGFTIKLKEGGTKYIPQGGHNKLSEKDMMFSAKYGRPVGLCYHHSDLFYKDESSKVKMTNQIMQIDKELEESDGTSEYRMEKKSIEVKV